MATRSPPEATPAPVEAIARVLVIGLLPSLEAAMRGGLTYRETRAQAWDRNWQAWQASYGDEVTIRAREILRSVGSAEILTPYGRDYLLARYPVEATQLALVEALNDERPTPVEGIGRGFWGRVRGVFGMPA